VWSITSPKSDGPADEVHRTSQAIEAVKLDWEIAKDAYSNSKKESTAKKDDNISPAVTTAKAD
jgi:hypothetical protein